MPVANQKVVGVNKEPCNRNNLYACINIEALNKAVLDLKPSALKVWLYFAKNQDNYVFELSSIAVQNFCGISDKSYRESIKELVAKRYLIKRGEGNFYDFYEIPKEPEMIKDGTFIECHTSTTFTF